MVQASSPPPFASLWMASLPPLPMAPPRRSAALLRASPRRSAALPMAPPQRYFSWRMALRSFCRCCLNPVPTRPLGRPASPRLPPVRSSIRCPARRLPRYREFRRCCPGWASLKASASACLDDATSRRARAETTRPRRSHFHSAAIVEGLNFSHGTIFGSGARPQISDRSAFGVRLSLIGLPATSARCL